MAAPLWPMLFWLGLAACFYYFLLAGGLTFQRRPNDEAGSFLAQFSFVGTGMLGVMALGYRAALPVANAVAGAIVMALALALYEWARRTIRDRRFHIAWSSDVPEELCAQGPYRFVRHPLYLSYILAFAALPVALPRLGTLGIFLLNLALFTHAARHDESVIARSHLAEEYEAYRARAGMFLPRGGARSGPAH